MREGTEVRLTPLVLYGEKSLVSVLPDHLLDFIQQDRHAPVLAGGLAVQDVVIVAAVFQQSLQLPSASEDVFLYRGAAQPVTTAEQHHGVEARRFAEQSLDVSQERPPFPGGEGRDHGEDQQQRVGARPQEGSSTLGLLPDALRGPPHGEPIPARGVDDGDPTAAHEGLPPQAQLRLLAGLEKSPAQNGVPHRTFPDALPAQQEHSQLCRDQPKDMRMTTTRRGTEPITFFYRVLTLTTTR